MIYGILKHCKHQDDFVEKCYHVECNQVCPYRICDGSGEINTDVDDGEGHTMRGVGSSRCPCSTGDREDS